MHQLAEAAPSSETPWLHFSRADRAKMVFAVFLVSMSSFMDRYIIAILQEPIRLEFKLSDTQLGLMSGAAFALLYATAGIPVARWADRGNRRNILALCVFVWSVMTALCGLAQSYLQLFLARIGVGIGEAGTLPPTNSLIGDYFPPEGRSTALAILTFGSSFGMALALMGGGYLAAHYGWRTAFLVFGLPGVLLAAALYAIVKEPRLHLGLARHNARPESVTVAIRALFRKHSYRHLVIASTIYFFVVSGAVLFMPTHLIRALGVPIQQVGFYFGLTSASAAALGALVGGQLADKLSRKDPRWMVRFPAIAMIAVLPLFLGFLRSDDYVTALACYFIAWFILTMGYPPIFAAVQAVAGGSRRAIAVALLLFSGTLLGNTLGPIVVGYISDRLAPAHGVNSLRYSLACVFMLLAWASWHFWHARRRFAAEIEDRLQSSGETGDASAA